MLLFVLFFFTFLLIDNFTTTLYTQNNTVQSVKKQRLLNSYLLCCGKIYFLDEWNWSLQRKQIWLYSSNMLFYTEPTWWAGAGIGVFCGVLEFHFRLQDHFLRKEAINATRYACPWTSQCMQSNVWKKCMYKLTVEKKKMTIKRSCLDRQTIARQVTRNTLKGLFNWYTDKHLKSQKGSVQSSVQIQQLKHYF